MVIDAESDEVHAEMAGDPARGRGLR